MLTDAGGLALALIAIRFSERPATPEKTYGYARMEVLSALANAVVLLLLAIYILYEAYKRFVSPPEILGMPMLVVAVIGLLVNLGSMLLMAGSKESLQRAHNMMRDEFGIEKTTIQIEHEGLHKVVDDDHAGNSDGTASDNQ